MNLQQRKAELEVELAKINAELSKKPIPEERFWEILRTISRPFLTNDTWPDEIFFFRDNDFIMSYDSKTKILWCSWINFWSVFEKECGMKYDDIQRMIKGQVEKAFKCGGVTPRRALQSIRMTVEKAFKCEGVTPYRHRRYWKKR